MPVIKRTIVKDMPNGDRYVAHLEARIAEDGERFVGGLSPTFSLTGDLFEKKGTRSGRRRHMHYMAEGGEVGPTAEPERGGAIGDELARVMPQLATFNRMHLAEPDGGEPMHAEANGWYWYAGSRDDLRIAVERAGGYTGSTGDGIYAHNLEARGLPDTDEGRRRYCYALACETLRVSEIPEMPGPDEIDDTEAQREIAILREQSREAATGVDVRDHAAVHEAQRKARATDREASKIERALIAESYARSREAFASFVDAQRDRWREDATAALELLRSLPEEVTA